MNLSKSKYTRFCQCPKMLWLDKNKPELAVIDEETKKKFEEGNEVGDLAMGLFGEFTEVTTVREDGSLNIAAMLAKTKALLAAGNDNICEAAFSAKNCYCAVDILHKEKGGYAIYEVKSSTDVHEVYLWDVAYQRWVLENAGVKVTGTYIVHVNSQYMREGELDVKKLFTVADVAEGVAAFYPLVEGNVARAREYLKQTKEPEMSIGVHCANPYGCAYWGYCGRDIPNPSVFDLYRISFEKACALYSGGIKSYGDLIDSGTELSDKQLTQVEFAVKNLPEKFDGEGVREFLHTLWYPLYYLDFETFQSVIPPFDGLRPYQQVPFQYSLHYAESKGGKLCHKEFLGDENMDPRRAIAESLAENIPQNACVLAYNKSFECRILKELAEAFPDLAEALMAIRENVRDLLDVFRGGCVYNKAMGGSFSIKSVLPALFPDDAELNYHGLSDVHNGTEAMYTYLSLRKLSGEEREKLRQSLLAYCKLDTYAMVKIVQYLQEKAGA